LLAGHEIVGSARERVANKEALFLKSGERDAPYYLRPMTY
jgi:hypothetical protein